MVNRRNNVKKRNWFDIVLNSFARCIDITGSFYEKNPRRMEHIYRYRTRIACPTVKKMHTIEKKLTKAGWCVRPYGFTTIIETTAPRNSISNQLLRGCVTTNLENE